MGATIKQTVSNNNTSAGATTVTATLTNVTAGSTLFMVIAAATGTITISSVSDGTNSWAAVSSSSPGFSYHALNVAAAASLTITVTMSASNVAAIIVREYANLLAAPFDKQAITTGNSATPTSAATTTTTAANELVIGWVVGHSTGTPTLGTGYGNLATTIDGGAVDSIGIEDKQISTTGTQTATYGVPTSNPWICGVATYQLATISPSPRLMMMGVGS